MKTGDATAAVVVPVKLDSSARELVRCIDSLIAARAASHAWKRIDIVIVDDRSQHPVAAALSPQLAQQVRIFVNCRTAGQAGALNDALQRIEADVYVFTDSDCVVAPTWLDAIASAYAMNVAAGAVAGPNWSYLPARGAWRRWLTAQESRLGEFNFRKYVQPDGRCSRFDCRNFSVTQRYLDELLSPGGVFFVEGAGPSVSGLTSTHWRDALTQGERGIVFCDSLDVLHEPVQGAREQLVRYFRWGRLGEYSRLYSKGYSGLLEAFLRRHCVRHFLAPSARGSVSFLYVWPVHLVFWIGIALESRRNSHAR
jgi:glycosyltransferase involved in cell wall biosynthesis